jgi:hypothetical protein
MVIGHLTRIIHAVVLELSQIVQFNRKAREGRKGTTHIQQVDPGGLGDAVRKISIRQPF